MFTVTIMNNIPVSLFLGPIFLILLFFICLIIVAGIKILYFYFKHTPVNLKPKLRKPKKVSAPAEIRKPVRSIEINPDEVDKIYVKKVS